MFGRCPDAYCFVAIRQCYPILARHENVPFRQKMRAQGKEVRTSQSMTKSQSSSFHYPFYDGPQITKEQLDKFIAIYKEEFGEELQWQDADPVAKDVVRLLDKLGLLKVKRSQLKSAA